MFHHAWHRAYNLLIPGIVMRTNLIYMCVLKAGLCLADLTNIYTIAFPILAFVILALPAFIWWTRRQSRLKDERMWHIDVKDLIWDEPPIVLGSFTDSRRDL